jgi:lipoprotein NlpI
MKPIRDSRQIQLLKTTLGQNDNIKQLLESAQTREQFCQAHYYVGARLMIDGYLEHADMLFKISLTSKADCIETVFAHVDSQTIRKILYENPNHPKI